MYMYMYVWVCARYTCVTCMYVYICPLIQDVVVGMRFGRFGREDGALILVSQGGALSVKILKRSVNFEVKDTNPRTYMYVL